MNHLIDPATELTVFNDSIRIFRTELFTRGCCGNKEFKLKKNLNELKQKGCNTVLSFGGVWSNHLHAFAYACEEIGLTAVAAVRGEEQVDTALLKDAAGHGLKVYYLSRAEYRQRNEARFIEQLCESLNCDACLPEGGSNELAVDGCSAIATKLNAISGVSPTHIVVAVGTGATMAGIACGANAIQQVVGVPVVQDDRLVKQIGLWIDSNQAATNTVASASWSMLNTAVPPKYGKVDKHLLEFVLGIHSQHGIVMDPVYTGKAFSALLDSELVKNPDNKIVFVHTGGIGGCLGFKNKFADVCGANAATRYLADAGSMINIES